MTSLWPAEDQLIRKSIRCSLWWCSPLWCHLARWFWRKVASRSEGWHSQSTWMSQFQPSNRKIPSLDWTLCLSWLIQSLTKLFRSEVNIEQTMVHHKLTVTTTILIASGHPVLWCMLSLNYWVRSLHSLEGFILSYFSYSILSMVKDTQGLITPFNSWITLGRHSNGKKCSKSCTFWICTFFSYQWFVSGTIHTVICG